jgi:hypothetical protein
MEFYNTKPSIEIYLEPMAHFVKVRKEILSYRAVESVPKSSDSDSSSFKTPTPS